MLEEQQPPVMIFDDEGMERRRDAARNCWVASEPIRSESRLSWSPALPVLPALQAKLWCSQSKFWHSGAFWTEPHQPLSSEIAGLATISANLYLGYRTGP